MSETAQSGARSDFLRLVGEIAAAIGDRPLDAGLAAWLNGAYSPRGAAFKSLAAAIEAGAEEGWLCQREAGGIRFGRPVKPGAEAGRFCVDVVHMPACAGPHHIHPQGEIGMIAPTEAEPTFDGHPEGWYVYGPGTAHHPTVRDGSAYVLYLLPGGAIEFTGR